MYTDGESRSGVGERIANEVGAGLVGSEPRQSRTFGESGERCERIGWADFWSRVAARVGEGFRGGMVRERAVSERRGRILRRGIWCGVWAWGGMRRIWGGRVKVRTGIVYCGRSLVL